MSIQLKGFGPKEEVNGKAVVITCIRNSFNAVGVMRSSRCNYAKDINMKKLIFTMYDI